jgi:hypothetical protein
MTPQRFVKRGSGEMVIAKNPAGKQLALPDDLVAKLDSTDWHVRTDAVAELGKLARQPNMTPLVKKAVLDRVSIERDVDVREAMVNLMARLGLARPDDLELEPKPKPPPPPPPQPQPGAWTPPQPSPIAPPMPLPSLDEWQTRVLVKSGVATAALTTPNGPYLLMELQRRANGLRIATYMHRAYIACVILLGLGAIGQIQNGNTDAAALYLLVEIGFGVAGLVNRKTLAAGPSVPGDPDMKRLREAIPLIEARWGWGFGWGKREYEANLYHRICWWMVAGGAVPLVVIAVSS